MTMSKIADASRKYVELTLKYSQWSFNTEEKKKSSDALFMQEFSLRFYTYISQQPCEVGFTVHVLRLDL